MNAHQIMLLAATLAWISGCRKDLGIREVAWPCPSGSDSDCAWGWRCVEGTCRPPGWAPDTTFDALDARDPSFEEVLSDVVEEGDAPTDAAEDGLVEAPEVVEADFADLPDDIADVPDDIEDVDVSEVKDTIEDTVEPMGDMADAEVCEPQCAGKECGDDGCGGTCGTCGALSRCEAGRCVPDCEPDCLGQECEGDNGCNGTCGTCDSDFECLGAACVAYTVKVSIEDLKTGLIWSHKVVSNLTWGEASTICASPWRVPTIDELRTLVVGCPDQRTGGKCGVTEACAENCSTTGCIPCGIGKGPEKAGGCYIPPQFADSCMRFWSSTVAEKDFLFSPSKMWVMNFQTGEIAAYSVLTNSIAVRCVKGP